MNKTTEDYLSEIYKLQFCNNRATKITEIASALNISKPSVSEMVRKLAKQGLLEFEKYGGVTLTKEGTKKARKVVRKHQLLEVFFKGILKIKNKFHSEAHKMEHSISDEATDKLDQVLKKPKVCPDGNPIPTKDAKVIELKDLSENSEAEVLFATTQKKECLERLNSLGVVPQTKIKIIRKMKKGPIILSVKGSEIALGPNICSKIFVEKK